MAKNKNKQNQIKSVETREDEIIILNEASEEQMIEIDTSALDEELKGTKGAALVMPIRGGTSDNSKKKEDKKDKSNKDKSGKNDSEDKKPSAQSIFSKFLEGEVKADEVKYESIEDLEDALESQNLIDLGKLVKTHPEILAAYFNAVGKKPSESKEVADDENVVDEENNEPKPVLIKLSKKERKDIEEKISTVMDKLNSTGYIKSIFKAIKKELGVDIANTVNRLLDILDNYTDEKFNNFIETIACELDSSKASSIIKYFTGGSAADLIGYLFNNGGDEDNNKFNDIKNKYSEIVTDDIMTQALSEAVGSDDLYKAVTKSIIRAIKSRVEEKLKKSESKSNRTTEEVKETKKTELRHVSKISEARNKHTESDTPAWYDFFAEARKIAYGK